MSKMFFNMLVVFAEFEAELLKMRNREGMAIARSRGKLKGKQPKLTARQQAELVRMHATGDYTIADLMEVFSIGRATVYRALGPRRGPARPLMRRRSGYPLQQVAEVGAVGRRGRQPPPSSLASSASTSTVMTPKKLTFSLRAGEMWASSSSGTSRPAARSCVTASE
jgi:hypothetical protein